MSMSISLTFLRALLACISVTAALLPFIASANGPITIDQMVEIATSGGSDVDGAKYVGGGGKWDPFNWHRPDDWPYDAQNQWGPDCSGFVAKVWQVDYLREPTTYGHDISTADLACPWKDPNAIWSRIDNWGARVEGDAFTNDTNCTAGYSVHTFLYGWDAGNGQWLIMDSSGTMNGVRYRYVWPQDYAGFVNVRRSNIVSNNYPNSGIIGVQANGSLTGITHQPMVGAYWRNGGFGRVGVPRYNGGGFFAHRWNSGYTQDVRNTSNNIVGALMEGDGLSPPMAYYVYGGIWNFFVSGAVDQARLRYPTGESDVNNTYQPFQNGYIIYYDTDHQFHVYYFN